MGIIGMQVDKLRLKLLLRDQYESVALRHWFASKFGVEAGLYTYGCFDRWRVPARTRFGRYCSFGRTARILDANHPVEALTTHPFLYEAKFGVVDRDLLDPEWLVIEDDVWIGHNVTIAASCKFIGRGAIIGAGAVVTKPVEPYAIMAGMPARTLRFRFAPDVIAAIEATRWWELDKAGLKRLVAEHPDAAFAPSVAALARVSPQNAVGGS